MIYNKHLSPLLRSIVISEDTENIIISDLIGNQKSGQVIICINSGVTVSSADPDDPAIYNDVESVFANIANFGSIIGKGGKGGYGVGSYDSSRAGTEGGVGGSAIKGDGICGVINYGIIGGGGGGGGGGGYSSHHVDYVGTIYEIGGGGGGGGGGLLAGGEPNNNKWGEMIGDTTCVGQYGGIFNGGSGGPGTVNFSGPSPYGLAWGGSGGGVGRSGEYGQIPVYSAYAPPTAGGVSGCYFEGRCYGGIATLGKGNCTISNGTPGVVTLSSHGLITGAQVSFQTTDELPSPLVAGTTYYAIKNDDDTIWLATSLANAIAGTKIATTTDGSGTHSMYYHGTFLGRVV